MPKAVESLAGYIKKIEALGRASSAELFFRGHSDSNYRATPSLFRNPNLYRSERDMFYSIISENSSEFESDRLTFDKLVRAQHYGIPTRLLDLSENALTGLFFSCESESKERGRVLVYEVDRLSIKYSMSDSVSCVSNLAHLTSIEKHQMVKIIDNRADYHFANYEFDNASLFDFREADPEEYQLFLHDVNFHAVFKRLVHFIREEKPHFENVIDPIDLLSNFFVYPKRNNPRITAQSGAFILFGLRRDQRVIISEEATEAADIKYTDKSRFLQSLRSLGVDEATVYPELARTAARIKKRYS